MNRTRRLLTAGAALALAAAGFTAYSTLGTTAAVGNSDKVLYLTFDDGPGDETVEILDVLREHDAKAVFFALGQELAQQTDTGRRIVAEGHALANHTWSHEDLTGLDADGRAHELADTAHLLERLGSASPCVRPPYGSTDAEVTADLAARGMPQVRWNIDTEDWTRPGATAIAARLLQAESGDVVLMHDGGSDRTQTVAALRQALPKLAAAGYTFDVVPGC
ncbi:polysaccharide deacetylase family protein [Promicromonospora sp. NPDC023987]|uniref:polysaccharide deacetylase family protein n=1 Tax=Promicromonospora sp. NPDC023987 TaxID=3155360 RepID=UPI0033DCE4B9